LQLICPLLSGYVRASLKLRVTSSWSSPFRLSPSATAAPLRKHSPLAPHHSATRLGITDTADLGGIVRFGLEARRQNLKPIVGAELVIDGCPAAFLARTKEGFNNLASLVTRSRVGELSTWQKGDGKKTRGRPRISWQQVAERSEGLQVLTGPASGPVASSLRAGDYKGAERTLCRWRDAFGDRLAVEVQLHHASGNESALATALIELAERHHVPWVICQEPRYIDNDSRLVHDVLTALRYDTTIDDALARGLLHPNGEWRLASPEEMAARWKGREAGLEESERIGIGVRFQSRLGEAAAAQILGARRLQ
jgi:DNA polymerase III alpha subunit